MQSLQGEEYSPTLPAVNRPDARRSSVKHARPGEHELRSWQPLQDSPSRDPLPLHRAAQSGPAPESRQGSRNDHGPASGALEKGTCGSFPCGRVRTLTPDPKEDGMPSRPTHFEIPVDDPDRAEKF